MGKQQSDCTKRLLVTTLLALIVISGTIGVVGACGSGGTACKSGETSGAGGTGVGGTGIGGTGIGGTGVGGAGGAGGAGQGDQYNNYILINYNSYPQYCFNYGWC